MSFVKSFKFLEILKYYNLHFLTEIKFFTSTQYIVHHIISYSMRVFAAKVPSRNSKPIWAPKPPLCVYSRKRILRTWQHLICDIETILRNQYSAYNMHCKIVTQTTQKRLSPITTATIQTKKVINFEALPSFRLLSTITISYIHTSICTYMVYTYACLFHICLSVYLCVRIAKITNVGAHFLWHLLAAESAFRPQSA